MLPQSSLQEPEGGVEVGLLDGHEHDVPWVEALVCPEGGYATRLSEGL